MKKSLIMMSGMPRSGSTLLTSILNQHPDVYATPTSPIPEVLDYWVQSWFNMRHMNKDEHKQQFGNMITGFLDGAYTHIDKRVVVDKNRMWPRLHDILLNEAKIIPKFIITVRDLTEVLTSYISLCEKTPENFIDRELTEKNQIINNFNRAKIIVEHFLPHAYGSLQLAFNSGSPICIVEYDEIVNSTQKTLDRVLNFIGVDNIIVDKNNLKPMKENDVFQGNTKNLHLVRQTLEKISKDPIQVLGFANHQYYTDMKLEFWKKDKRYINRNNI